MINLSLLFQTLNSGLVKKGGLSCGDVAAQYKYKNAALNVKADTESNVVTGLPFPSEFRIMIISNASLFVEQVSTMLTITDILPSTKTIASIKLPDYKSGKVLTFLSL